MKFTVITDNLEKSLHIVGKAVNNRSPLPVLSNILISAEKGRLKVTASNLQVTISAVTGAKIDSTGEITIPARILTDFVSQVIDEKIDGNLEGSTLELSTERSKSQFMGTPASEFPDLADVKGGINVELDSKEFAESLQKVQFAVAVDEGRPVLTGVYIKILGSSMTLAGTDGFRMAECKLKIPAKIEEEIKCVLPAKSLADIVKTFSAESEKLTFTINSERNIATVKTDDLEARLRMLEGEYPAYEAIVPTEFTTEIKFSKEELSSGVKMANVFAKDTGNVIKIKADSETIEVLSQPTESGSNSTKIVGQVEGDDLEIAFNAKYLIEFFGVITEEDIVFKASEPTKPGLFVIEGFKDYFYLVMPMKASW